FLTIDPSDPQLGPYDIFIDHIVVTDAADNEILISDAEFANPFPGFRGQSTSTGNSSVLSTLASYDGVSSDRIQWEFPNTALSNACAPCRPCVTFADTAKTVSFRLLVENPRLSALSLPDVVATAAGVPAVIGDAPFIRVENIDLTADKVELLVNGNPAGEILNPASASVDITPTVALNVGDSISARYTTPARADSDLAYPHAVTAPPAPAVQSSLVEGQTSVTVSGILNAPNAAASAVTLIIDGTPLAPVDPAGATVVVIDVGGSLTAGQQVTANQVVNALTSTDSAPVGVGTGETVCVVINEFSYDDSETDDREYVELYNADAVPVDISGWTLRASDTVAPPNDTNPDYVIPAATILASGDYYVLGAATVANVDQVVGVNDLWENDNEALELLDQNGVVVDTVIYELNKGPVAVSPAEGGIYANHRSNDGFENSWSRWFDGLDTDNNGADFGVRPPTPGATNSLGSLAPLADNFDGGAVGASVPTWLGSFVDLIYIDPTVADTNNTAAIAASPGSGGLAAIAWDPAGGGNTVVLMDEARYGVSFTCLVYIDVSDNAFTTGNTSGEFEQWDIGLGTAGTFYNTGLGSTGLVWKYRRTEDLDTGTLGSVVLDLVDENDAGPDETVLFSVPGGSLTTGWHTLSLTRNYENYSASFDADATSGVLVGNGPSAMFIGYQEFLAVNNAGRPPTIDDLSITVPAAPTLGACCTECDCQVLTTTECAAIAGFYAGNGSDCSDADTNGLADICEAFVPPAPTVAGTLCDGGMVVTVTGIVIESSEVSVFEGANPIGTAPTSGASTVAVFVTPALADGQSITAVQTAGGIDSPASAAVVVTTCPGPGLEVVINEFSYDDSGTDTIEFVELYNTGASPVDVGGWALRASDTVAPPGDNNADYGIPAGTILAAGDYYVLGSALVPNVDLVVGTVNLWENSNEAIELIDNTGGVQDTVIYELNKGLVAIAPAEGGIFGNFVSIEGNETSWARYLDGVDSDNNGRDFGLRLATPGADNLGPGSATADFIVADVDGLSVGDPHPGMIGSFVGPQVIDPTVGAAGTPNPSAIPVSPQGGLCSVAWDPTGGGNAVVSHDVLTGSSYDMYVYIDTTPYGIGGAESTSYGIEGTTGTFYNWPDPSGLLFGGSPRVNGNTGIGWLFEKEDSASLISMKLYDAGDGGNSAPGGEWTVITDIDMTLEPPGWHRISIDYDKVTGNVVAKFDNQTFNFTTDAGLIGGVYIGYRESLQGDLFKLRPPTFDRVEAVPAATDWQSCALHDPAGAEGPPTTWCMDIVEVQNPPDPCDPRTDTQIECRFYGSGPPSQSFHQVVIDLDGAATGAVTVDAVCTDATTHGATVTVSSDGLTVTAEFTPPLPNTECCTMTLGGGATGSQVIKILQGDVNGSGRVNATDKNLVKGKITSRTPPLVCDDFFYDVNMSGRINATDKNLVKAKITTANELDQSAGCGLP
ncbi:MAG: lamin tail domain-containing protein, partial [Planctomycetes bacterium]|nr:lamin tail domain-containing protein [Planctomycetota bacterium]